jgi:hypothetical protein
VSEAFPKHRDVQPGDKSARTAPPVGRICDAFDILKRDDAPSLSIEQINRIAAQAWAGKR